MMPVGLTSSIVCGMGARAVGAPPLWQVQERIGCAAVASRHGCSRTQEPAAAVTARNPLSFDRVAVSAAR